MSTLTVANVETANGSTDLTLMTGNSSGPKLVITAGGSILFNNINVGNMTAATSTITNPYTTNTLTVIKQLNLIGNTTPANLSADNTVDWAPGVAGDYQIRFQANSTNATILEYNVYGLTGGVDGQIITLTNIGPTKVVLRTEESGNSTFNQANSVNRFSLPNHIPLEGYQSIELYYDGTSQRWRGVDTQGFSFFHKQALTKGFFAGGGTPSRVVTTDRTTYATESTAAVSGANLNVIRNNHAGAGNGDKGFFIGTVASVERTTYATETTATTFSLSPAKNDPAATGNVDKGFWSGGTAPGPVTTTTSDRVNYSTETSATISGAALSQARTTLAAAGNSEKGFFAGGSSAAPTPSVAATADRTRYSTETTAAVSGANLSQARERIKAAGNENKGFFSGGISGSTPAPTYVATTGRTTYSTEVHAAVTGANLSQARAGVPGAGSQDKGFFAGGITATTPVAILVATADRTTYSTEVTAAVSGANLSQARSDLAAI